MVLQSDSDHKMLQVGLHDADADVKRVPAGEVTGASGVRLACLCFEGW
jgi:hypothetical protein